jgi:hypothetical protein
MPTLAFFGVGDENLLLAVAESALDVVIGFESVVVTRNRLLPRARIPCCCISRCTR